jgi:hypothetical protein
MKIRCDISGITPEQSVICLAVQAIYEQQSLTRTCELLALDPLTFSLKTNLTAQQQQRLFADMVGMNIDGYVGVIENDQLVLSPQNAKPSKPKRKGQSKGNADIQTGELQQDS